MQLRKYRWSRAYESAEEELVELLAARRITAIRWEAEEDSVIEVPGHNVDKQLWCAEGQLTLQANDTAYSLQPGDVIDIPAHTPYEIRARFGGCVCYESPPA